MAERLFIGIPVTAEARRQLVLELGRSFPGGLRGRAVPPENWHLTLRFIGEVDSAPAARLRGELGAGGLGQPFELHLDRFGAFPSPRRARVLWVGAGVENGAVHDLAAAVEGCVRRAGFGAEPRPFSPHITLTRLRDPEDLRPSLSSAAMPSVRLVVSQVVLFRSRLGGPTARYEVVECFPL